MTWTPADVAAELAVPEARVRAWMAAGLLVAPNGLTDGALHRFLCEHRAAWQAHCPPPSLWIASLLRDPDMRRDHRHCARRWHAAARDRAAAKARKAPVGRKARAWALSRRDWAALAWKDAA